MPDFPPLFEGRVVATEPLEAAVAAAVAGCQAGLVLHRPLPDAIDAAVVMAPEVPLADAAAMMLVAGLGFADAFGALAPPEVALHLEWPGGLRIEGARCGGLRLLAPECGDAEVPGWLVIGLSVPVERSGGAEPGAEPDTTDLRAEGVTVPPEELLSAWTRHMLSWIVRWEEEGMAPVHRDWIGRAWGKGRPLTVATASGERSGMFQGLDERGGILLKAGSKITLVPLTEVIGRHRC